MKLLTVLLAFALEIVPAPAATDPIPALITEGPRNEFMALCWHDVVDESAGEFDADPYSISTADLLQQLEWLAAHDYTAVRIDDLLAAQAGERPLPERAVLLTFDDGLASVRERVLPLLRLYDFPAVVSIVGAWTETAGAGPSAYLGDGSRARRYATWDDLRELVDSGLVEIASHSYAGHTFVPSDPQGNLGQSYVTRRFESDPREPGRGAREEEAAYLARVNKDLERNLDLIEQRLGLRPRVMTWPYGRSNGAIETLASELGATVTLGLRKGVATAERLVSIPRHTPRDLPSLVWQLHLPDPEPPVRSVTLDLERLDDENPAARARNLERAALMVAELGVNRVYLKAFATDQEGLARAAYFPSGALPMRRDLLNHAAHLLREDAGVEVYAWLPVRGLSTAAADPFCLIEPDHIYLELSEDLARSAAVDGLLLHDRVEEGESSEALADRIVRRVRELRDVNLKVARGLEAAKVLAATDAELATLLADRRVRFDETVVVFERPLPRPRGPLDVARRLTSRPRAAGTAKQGHSTVLLLPTTHGSKKSATRTLRNVLRELTRAGFLDFGTGLDQDLGRLELDRLRSALSGERYPYRRP